MYLLTTRLRHFPEAVAPKWHQQLTDHFFSRAEELMITHHSIHSGSIRSRYLKDLFSQWRGVIVSYDEGILKGDAILAAAIWRNAFKGRPDVDAKSLAQIVGWMRRELVRLQEAEDVDIASANWTFESPKDEARTVMIESRLMKEGIDEEL
jgi:cytochrome b pre-mRNA-processing protein 3